MRNIIFDADSLAAGTYYSREMKLVDEKDVEQSLSILAGGITGTTTTVDVTPQFSFDKKDWFSQSVLYFDQVDTATALPYSESISTSFNALWVRYKVVVAGDGEFTGKIRAVAK